MLVNRRARTAARFCSDVYSPPSQRTYASTPASSAPACRASPRPRAGGFVEQLRAAPGATRALVAAQRHSSPTAGQDAVASRRSAARLTVRGGSRSRQAGCAQRWLRTSSASPPTTLRTTCANVVGPPRSAARATRVPEIVRATTGTLVRSRRRSTRAWPACKRRPGRACRRRLSRACARQGAARAAGCGSRGRVRRDEHAGIGAAAVAVRYQVMLRAVVGLRRRWCRPRVVRGWGRPIRVG